MVTLILGLVFRRKLIDLIPLIKKLKAGPLEAEFERDTEKILANANAVTAHAKPLTTKNSRKPNESTAERDGQVIAILLEEQADPAGAILEGWEALAAELFRLGAQMKLFSEDSLINSTKAFSLVMASGVLPAETMRLVQELRALRNRVTHQKLEPTRESAEKYVAATTRAFELIRNYRKNLPHYAAINR